MKDSLKHLETAYEDRIKDADKSRMDAVTQVETLLKEVKRQGGVIEFLVQDRKFWGAQVAAQTEVYALIEELASSKNDESGYLRLTKLLALSLHQLGDDSAIRTCRMDKRHLEERVQVCDGLLLELSKKTDEFIPVAADDRNWAKRVIGKQVRLIDLLQSMLKIAQIERNQLMKALHASRDSTLHEDRLNVIARSVLLDQHKDFQGELDALRVVNSQCRISGCGLARQATMPARCLSVSCVSAAFIDKQNIRLSFTCLCR
eukprot:GHVS01017595.1.p1 GENE.GHVS01017595.1~~GHVS01017595.1.p1  ORF type:complete len:260 (+),score=19.54 GHVS01017595.1:330-1109(+)